MRQILFFICSLITLLGYSQWTQINSNIEGAENGEKSGTSISISDDGSIIAIGAPIHDLGKGTLRIYENKFGIWTQIGSDIDGIEEGVDGVSYGGLFGHSVSLSGDGKIVAAGGYNYDDEKGVARIFENKSGVWTQIGSDILGNQIDERFGYSISLSGDGKIVAIGAYQYNTDRGRTKIYENNSGVWTQIGSDITGPASSSRSARSISLSDDGNIIAIAAENYFNGRGRTRVYENNLGTWTQVGGNIDGIEDYENSGSSVSLSDDGNILAIGADDHDGFIGTCRIFENKLGVWTQIGTDIDGDNPFDRFGRTVSLSGDGNIVAIGSSSNDANKGLTRVYENKSGVWTQIDTDINGITNYESSGKSVSISKDGSFLAVGATSFNISKGVTRIYNNSVTLSNQNEKIKGLNLFTINNKIVSNLPNISIRVLDILGKQILNQNLQGIYLVKAVDVKGNTEIRKISTQ